MDKTMNILTFIALITIKTSKMIFMCHRYVWPIYFLDYHSITKFSNVLMCILKNKKLKIILLNCSRVYKSYYILMLGKYYTMDQCS